MAITGYDNPRMVTQQGENDLSTLANGIAIEAQDTATDSQGGNAKSVERFVEIQYPPDEEAVSYQRSAKAKS